MHVSSFFTSTTKIENRVMVLSSSEACKFVVLR